jgi:hypothetical protein
MGPSADYLQGSPQQRLDPKEKNAHCALRRPLPAKAFMPLH